VEHPPALNVEGLELARYAKGARTCGPSEHRLMSSAGTLPSTSPSRSGLAASGWATLAALTAFTALTLTAPVARAFYRFQIGYNEGWNLYSVQSFMHGARMYDQKFGWTTWNYPLGSLYIVGYLAKLIGDPLLAGRLAALAALLISCALAALIVKKLTRRWAPAVFAATFCLGVFSTAASGYVTMADPTLLAHPFMLAALFLYLPQNRRVPIAAVALLFVLGGDIKHNLLAAPLAVALDLFLVSWSKALRFVLVGIVFLAATIAAGAIGNGPYFFSHIFSPRHFSIFRTLYFLKTYAALQIPLAASLAWSIWKLRDPKFRVISLYFLASLAIGFWFTGGSGASENMYFDNFFAMAIVAGLCVDYFWNSRPFGVGEGSLTRVAPPLLLYAGVVFAFGQSDSLNLPRYLANLSLQQTRFSAEAAYLAAQPGSAICESLLRCYDAGKPYIYDPYNSTAMVNAGKLDAREFVDRIAERQFGAIQTTLPVNEVLRPNDRFPNAFLDAIDRYYRIALRDPDCVIYVPRS
jgi:hypothetical protein